MVHKNGVRSFSYVHRITSGRPAEAADSTLLVRLGSIRNHGPPSGGRPQRRRGTPSLAAGEMSGPYAPAFTQEKQVQSADLVRGLPPLSRTAPVHPHERIRLSEAASHTDDDTMLPARNSNDPRVETSSHSTFSSSTMFVCTSSTNLLVLVEDLSGDVEVRLRGSSFVELYGEFRPEGAASEPISCAPVLSS